MPDRIIKESICTSETLSLLSDFEERFWHRLIVNCDDFGRFYANPAILRGKLFPLADGKTKKDMSDALNKLASVGLVELYTVDGKPFLHVVKWSKYQRTRAARSKFPSPDDGCIQSSSDTCCQLPSNVPVFVCENRESNSYANAGVDAPARVKAPTLEQVMEIAKQRGCPECAKPFFDYYDSGGWRDGDGKPVFNWQQKFVLWQQRQERMEKQKSSNTRRKGPLTDIGTVDQKTVLEDMERMRKYMGQLGKENEDGD